MNLYCIVFALISFIGGILFVTGEAPRWIKAFRDMSSEEKSKINMKRLCRNASIVFFSASILFMLAFIFPIFKEKAFIWCMILWLICTGADVYYIGKSKRYIHE